MTQFSSPNLPSFKTQDEIMKRSMNIQQVIIRSPLCLLGLLGLIFTSPVTAQVFDSGPSGPSDPALFDTVINIPSDPDIGDNASIDGDGFRL